MSTVLEDTKIKIVDYGPTREFKYGDVKNTVVRINEKYYLRTGEHVTQIKDASGKLRFFRKKSPQITPDLDNEGMFLIKAECYQTEDGIYLNKQSPNVVQINGKYYRKQYCVPLHDGTYALKTDENIVKCKLTGHMGKKEDFVLLSKLWYPPESYVLKAKAQLVELTTGELILKKDGIPLYNPKIDQFVTYHRQDRIFKSVNSKILYDFQDKTNPQIDRLEFVMISTEHNDEVVTLCLLPGIDDSSVVNTTKSRLSHLQHQIDAFVLPRYKSSILEWRTAINKNFSDLDSTENVAKIFKHVPKPWGGKVQIMKSSTFPTPVLSKTFKATGGIEYSFGLEFETSEGLMSEEDVEKLGVNVVGDRSVGAGEYVTPPLNGDLGIDRIMNICEALNKSTLVDDRCGIHVHVGGWKGYNEPSFDDEFIMNAIKLGALLEEELYMTLPTSRKPTLYHCHSIKRWADINKENFNDYVGAYVYGEKEWWSEPTQQCPVKLFRFQDYSLNSSRNRSNPVTDHWPGGKYKWLNLVPSYKNKNKTRTIEFRIFSPTTTFRKTYAYILTSLAFTWVIDNKTGIIKKGVTLNDVFNAAFKDHPNLIEFLTTFYCERKDKFKRKDIYPKSKELTFLS